MPTRLTTEARDIIDAAIWHTEAANYLDGCCSELLHLVRKGQTNKDWSWYARDLAKYAYRHARAACFYRKAIYKWEVYSD
jgi:hypothetical protein